MTSSLSGSVLTVTGTDAADDIRLDVDPVFINLLRVRINGTAEHFLLGDYTAISLQGGAGNDRIEISDLSAGQPKSLTVDAGAGDDDVIGSPYADRLAGGDGNDSIHGNGGNDTLHGDAGNDTLKGDAGDDQVNGDAGDDQLSDNAGFKNVIKGGDGKDAIAFTNASVGVGYGGDGADQLTAPYHMNPPAGYEAYGAQVTLYGDAGDDHLTGVVMHGGDGADRFSTDASDAVTVYGDGGDDVLHFTKQFGIFDGGSGNDNIDVPGGNVEGGAGNDRIVVTNGIAGRDLVISGGGGDDDIRDARTQIDSRSGTTLSGGDGNDTIHRGLANDAINGDAGRDMLYGGSGNDILHGGTDADSLWGGDGTDLLYGDSGDDYLFGSPKADVGYAGLATIDLIGTTLSGNDYAYGGKGVDWIDPDYDWQFVEADPKDVKTGAKGLSSVDFSGGSLGSISTNYSSGGGTILTTPLPGVTSSWNMTYAGTAVFAGVNTDKPTSAQLAAVAVPPLSAARRKAVKAGVLHVPANWQLTPLADSSSSVAWYRVARPSQPFALVDGTQTVTTQTYYGTTTQSTIAVRSAVALLGVAPKTLIVLDSPPDEPTTTKWVPTTGWRTTAVATTPSTLAWIPGHASPLHFGEPTGTLPTVSAGKRAIFTLDGVILIDDTGAQLSA